MIAKFNNAAIRPLRAIGADLKYYFNHNNCPADSVSEHRKDSWAAQATPLLHVKDWEIIQDHHWCILGPNGSGKTTLVKALRGEAIIPSGTLQVNLEKHHIKIVSFSQSVTLQAIAEKVKEYGYYEGMDESTLTVNGLFGTTSSSSSSSSSSIQLLFDYFELPQNIQKRSLISLSTGEFRKVQLIRALVDDSVKLLVLDEVFDGLDVSARKNFSKLLLSQSFNKNKDLPKRQYIFISHREQEMLQLQPLVTHALELNDKSEIVYQGRIENFQSIQRLSYDDEDDTQMIKNDFIRFQFWDNKEQHPSRSLVLMQNISFKGNEEESNIVENFEWEIKQGEHWVLKGQNGIGKTKVLELITGENLAKYSNQVHTTPNLKIGIVSNKLHAEAAQYHIPVQEMIWSGFLNIVGPIDESKVSLAMKETTLEWMKTLGIPTNSKNNNNNNLQIYSQLSQGQQRLVLIARALVKRADLLILDEPFHGLSFIARERLKLILQELIIRNKDLSLILVTHYDDEIPDISLFKTKILGSY